MIASVCTHQLTEHHVLLLHLLQLLREGANTQDGSGCAVDVLGCSAIGLDGLWYPLHNCFGRPIRAAMNCGVRVLCGTAKRGILLVT
jgi:hypothetical protein